MSYTFDCVNKIIQLTTTSELDMLDLYSRWKDEVISAIAGCEQAFRVIKEPLAGSTFIGPYYFIMNDWQIRPLDVTHELIVSGTLVQDATSAETPFKVDDLTSNVQIVRTVATEVQVVETAGPLTPQDISDISTAVWQEPIAGRTLTGTMGWYNLLSGRILLDTEATGTPTTTEIQLSAGSVLDDFYNDQLIYIVGGTGIGQTRVVLDYIGATRTVIVDEPWIVTPVATDRILIQTDHVHPVTQIAEGILNADL